jgi:hypothetical protein
MQGNWLFTLILIKRTEFGDYILEAALNSQKDTFALAKNSYGRAHYKAGA